MVALIMDSDRIFDDGTEVLFSRRITTRNVGWHSDLSCKTKEEIRGENTGRDKRQGGRRRYIGAVDTVNARVSWSRHGETKELG